MAQTTFRRLALPRTRVIHLHGVAERDHQSLMHMPPDKLRPVVQMLFQEKYSGVLTLEIFNEDDLRSSEAALAQVVADLFADAQRTQNELR